jgi:hypothetical protein
MTGTTPVSTTAAFVRVWRATVISAGSDIGAYGNITVRGASLGNTQAYIKLGANQTLMSHFTPPANMSMLVVGGTLAAEQGKAVHYHVKTRDAGSANSVWKIKRAFDVYQASHEVTAWVPRLIKSMTDYKWTQEGVANGDKVSGDYSFILLDNALINPEEADPLGNDLLEL